MRRTTILKLLVAAVTLGLALQVAGCHSRAQVAKPLESKLEAKVEKVKQESRGGEKTSQSDIDLPEREEIRQSYQLAPEARVTLSGITGSVNIETADIKTAEVYIVRSARQREDFEYHQVKIENSPNLLAIRVERRKERSVLFSVFSSPPEGRQRVMLKLPREIELSLGGVSGPVTVGEIAGAVKMNGVNGSVKVARASSSAIFSGINGPVEATVTGLGSDGVRVNGVNGNIELHFANPLNADLIVRNINGRIEPDLPNMKVKEGARPNRSNLMAQLGNGGLPIIVSGVNGNVRLTGPTAANSQAPAAAQR